jgi:P27 family predicted phage terminase small subunit
MVRGPKPKSTTEHKLHGTFRTDRHGPVDHPIDKLSGVPKMPPGMPKQAQKMWKVLVPQLVKTKSAVEIDSTELAAMCRWWAQYNELMTRVEDETPYDDDSDIRQWRLEKRAKAAWAAFDSIASRFGLTPSDRARLRSEPQATRSADPLSHFGISIN